MKVFLAHWATRAAGLFLLLALSGIVSHAQPGSGGPQPAGPTSTPIDGGTSLLLASGVAFALKKLRRRPR